MLAEDVKLHYEHTSDRIELAQSHSNYFHFQWAALQTLLRGKELHWWAAGTYLSKFYMNKNKYGSYIEELGNE